MSRRLDGGSDDTALCQSVHALTEAAAPPAPEESRAA
jgi:hypothetical protein